MPAIHEFPPPPRPGSSKPNGHGHQTNGYRSEDETSHTASPLRESHEREEEESDEEEEEEHRVVVHRPPPHPITALSSFAPAILAKTVEVRQRSSSYIQSYTIKQNLVGYLQSEISCLEVGTELMGWRNVGILGSHVERVWVSEASEGEFVELSEADIHIHIYKPSTSTRLEEFSTTTEDDDEAEQVPAASIRDLPSTELDGLWENLIYADDLKGRLLNYIHSTASFSDAEIDPNIVSWNRMVLLHGPPGTGKTSLCRALAQKLSIRLSDRYTYGRIIEINSHSLFSKWFSESGKLVQKLFSKVNEMVDDDRAFIVVLIDEVESLTAARAGAMSGNEPSDAVRVVNALLTQLDKLKTKKNVLVVTTSNIAGAIDSAFVDRADIKEYVGLPPPQAVYWILAGSIAELSAKGMIRSSKLCNWKVVDLERKSGGTSSDKTVQNSLRLAELAYKCTEYGLAGRFLRRILVLAHARYLPVSKPGEVPPRSLAKWLNAMERVVQDERRDRDIISRADGQRGKGTDHKDVATRTMGDLE